MGDKQGNLRGFRINQIIIRIHIGFAQFVSFVPYTDEQEIINVSGPVPFSSSNIGIKIWAL
jgi:hypothetical protein